MKKITDLFEKLATCQINEEACKKITGGCCVPPWGGGNNGGGNGGGS